MWVMNVSIVFIGSINIWKLLWFKPENMAAILQSAIADTILEINECIVIQISAKFVSKILVNYNTALVLVMT